MNELKHFPLVFKDQDQEKVVSLGLSKEAKPLNVIVETDTKQLKPWTPLKSLRQRILEDNRPQAELYKQLIRCWPSISDAKLKEILEGTPRDRVEKVLTIHKESGKLFTEFLEPNITYEEILLLDRVHRYYLLLSQAKRSGLLENLKNGFKYDVSVDGKKYQAELLAFVDNVPVSINFYPDSFNRPVLGVPYSDWPCLPKARERLRQKAEALAASLKELRFNKDEFMNLETELEYVKMLEQDFMPLNIENFIIIPPKYTVKQNLLGPHIYVNRINLPCGLCNKGHQLWLIAKVR
jgi:hypothetical protein